MPENYYNNICTNIRFTDDISFKLLGLVPLFSGAGMLVAVLKTEYTWSPAIYAIAAFGALVTLGLFRWELRNIQTCDWLIARGADVEQKEDEKRAGQFYQRANAPMGVGKTEAEKLIYGVTIFTWLSLPWLVYTAATVKNNAAPPVIQQLNKAYIVFAVIVGLLTLVSIIVPLKWQPKLSKVTAPPAK
jgi:hypothetical protein